MTAPGQCAARPAFPCGREAVPESPRPRLQPQCYQKICMQVQLLAPQKPVNRPGWWKGKFTLFQMPATGGQGGWQTCVQRPDDKQGVRAFIGRVGGQGGGLHTEKAQSSLTVIFKLFVSGLTSSILVVLGTVNLQFWCALVPISLPSVLGIVAAHVLGTV